MLHQLHLWSQNLELLILVGLKMLLGLVDLGLLLLVLVVGLELLVVGLVVLVLVAPVG